MLVLDRRANEAVVIHAPGIEPIRVTLVRIRDGSRAKLGFEAPAEVRIYREEIAPEDGNDA